MRTVECYWLLTHVLIIKCIYINIYKYLFKLMYICVCVFGQIESGSLIKVEIVATCWRQVGGGWHDWGRTSGNMEVGTGCCSGPRPSPRPRVSRQQHALTKQLTYIAKIIPKGSATFSSHSKKKERKKEIKTKRKERNKRQTEKEHTTWQRYTSLWLHIAALGPC